jgi:LPXTG-motif cell wall-anchored protein
MKTTISRFKAVAATLALSFALLAGGQAAVVYLQPFDMSGVALASQNDTGSLGNFATMYDNFVLGAAATINNVEWTGEYFNPPIQGPITAWTVSFYADDGGEPGALLMRDNMAGTANEAFVGNFAGFPAYKYSFNLSMAFNAAAGTQYWLSVVPDLADPPQWGWSTGLGGDGVSVQDFFGNRYTLTNDVAFTLNGIPEPNSITLAGFGLALGGAVIYFRRRRI